MSFALFVLLNAILLIRPEELLPAIAGARLYLVVIGLCLLTTGSRVLAVLRPRELAGRPITVCVLGLLVAGSLSQLARAQIGLAWNFAGEFGKVVLYYLLLISVLDTPRRFEAFLGWLVALVTGLVLLGLLQFHEVIDLEAIRPLERNMYDARTGEATGVIPQLRSSGIFSDPNDLCLILVTGLICALYRASSAVGVLGRVLWLTPAGLCGYALILTQSRGGLLGLLAAILAWAYVYFGWRRTLCVMVLLVPALGMIGGGRQTNMNLGRDDTAYQRLELWWDGLAAVMRNPVTGIGVDEFSTEMGLVSHNSFVHALVEMGLLGSGLFLGAFYLCVAGLIRSRESPARTLVRLRPFMLAVVVGCAGGIFSISRCYVITTYQIIGLVEAYLYLSPGCLPSWFRVDGRMIARLAGIAVGSLIALRLLTGALMQMSS
jgi:O-antigen ligase